MTREEFMRIAECEINDCFSKQRNRLMMLVDRAWAEGKRNAETEKITEMVRVAIEEIQKQIQPVIAPQITPTWPFPPASPTIIYDSSKGDAPEAHFGGDTDG